MGLLSAFKNIDLKDKVGDFWEYIDDPVKKVLGETVNTLNRPSGATRGALASLFDEDPNNSFENILAGWKDPNKFQPDTGNRALDIGVQAATDPLTYVPVVGQVGLAKMGLRAPKLLSPLLSTVASPQSSLTKQIAGEVAVNAAARGGSELGAKLTQGTPLEGVGGIAGGLIGGAVTARKFSGPVKADITDWKQRTQTYYDSSGKPVPEEQTFKYALEDAKEILSASGFRDFGSFEDRGKGVYERLLGRPDLFEDNAVILPGKGALNWYPNSTSGFNEVGWAYITPEARKSNTMLQLIKQAEQRVGPLAINIRELSPPMRENLFNHLEKPGGMQREILSRFYVQDSKENPVFLWRGLAGAARKTYNENAFPTKLGMVEDQLDESNPRFAEMQKAREEFAAQRQAPVWTVNNSFEYSIGKAQKAVTNAEDYLAKTIESGDEAQITSARTFLAQHQDTLMKEIAKRDALSPEELTQELKTTNPTGSLQERIQRTAQLRQVDRDKSTTLNELDNIRQEIITTQNNIADVAQPGSSLVEHQKYLDDLLKQEQDLRQNINNPLGDTAGQGDNLIDDITENASPNGLTPEQRLAMYESGDLPPIGGGALTPPELEKLITSYGYDPKVAKHLDSIAPKDREALAQTMVDNIGAQGADAEFLRTVIQDYRKTGIQDPTKMAKLNNMLRGAWATGDGSWFGIQGLLTIPRLLSKGDFKDAYDLLTVPMFTMVGNKKVLSQWMHRTIDSTPEDFPKLSEIGADGRLHLAFLKGNVDFEFKVFDKLVPFVKPDEAFMAAGDVARVSMFYNEWRRYGAGLTGEARTKAIEDISRAVNRATGIAEHPFGGQIGSFALFASRFFQSQLEIVTKSFTDGGIEGKLARRQLATLVGTGTMLTLAANYVRGEETDLDPRSSNFMRIKNINGNDISVFGPWDSLVKLFVHLGQGDLTYARTKAGPLVSLAMSMTSKSDFLGNPVESNPYKIAQAVGTGVIEQAQAGDINPLNLPGRIDEASRNTIKSLFVPFAWQDVGNQNFTGGVANFFGVKNSPLSPSEIVDANMQNLGLDPNDPLARRQYFADHPEDRSKFSKEQQRVNSVKDDIQFRREANDAKLINGEQSLTDWRESRKNLSRESMNKMAILMEGVDFKSDTPQKKWIDSYFQLFQGSQDPITHDIDSQKFDKLQSTWLQANGPKAFDYVQRFLQVGKSDIELSYLNDMKQLDRLGYFSLPRYKDIVYEYSGGMSDDQIQNYRDRVSAARSINPELAKMTFKKALLRVYGDVLTYEQIKALDLAGSDKYGNPAIDEIKDNFPYLVTWFNPKATWDTYQAAKGNATEVPQVYKIPALIP